jgi:hypothetical protein
MAQRMGQIGPGAGAQMFEPGVDPDEQYQAEAENLTVLAHEYTLQGVEERLLQTEGVTGKCFLHCIITRKYRRLEGL